MKRKEKRTKNVEEMESVILKEQKYLEVKEKGSILLREAPVPDESLATTDTSLQKRRDITHIRRDLLQAMGGTDIHQFLNLGLQVLDRLQVPLISVNVPGNLETLQVIAHGELVDVNHGPVLSTRKCVWQQEINSLLD